VTASLSPVIERIRKLLALSRDVSNEHEAALAAQKAHELLDRHNLSLLNIEETAIESAEQIIVVGKRMPGWQKITASAAAFMADCGVVVIRSRGSRSHKLISTEICFFGLPENAQAAVEIYHYFCVEIEGLCLQSSTSCLVDRFTNSYRVGCAARIYDEVQKLKQTAGPSSQSTALVRIGNAIAIRHKENHYPHSRKGRPVTADEIAYLTGYGDAAQIPIHRERRLQEGVA